MTVKGNLRAGGVSAGLKSPALSHASCVTLRLSKFEIFNSICLKMGQLSVYEAGPGPGQGECSVSGGCLVRPARFGGHVWTALPPQSGFWCLGHTPPRSLRSPSWMCSRCLVSSVMPGPSQEPPGPALTDPETHSPQAPPQGPQPRPHCPMPHSHIC